MKARINVVVVDDNEVLLNTFYKYFAKSTEVCISGLFKDGPSALEFLTNNPEKYEVVVMDIVLAKMDGIRLLEELHKKVPDKKIIVLSSFKDDYTIRKVQSLGAIYYMLKPIDITIIRDRILDAVEHNTTLTKARDSKLEMELCSLLHSIGIPSHIRGYSFIKDGVMLLYSSDKLIKQVTKDVYPKIAQKYDTTTTRVERAIRHAVELSWDRGDINLLEDIFGNSVDFNRSRPTNAEFITAITEQMKLKQIEMVS